MKVSDIIFQADNVSAICKNQFRSDFPILNLKIGDKSLVYLDNAASSQMPQSVIDRLVRYHMNMKQRVANYNVSSMHVKKRKLFLPVEPLMPLIW